MAPIVEANNFLGLTCFELTKCWATQIEIQMQDHLERLNLGEKVGPCFNRKVGEMYVICNIMRVFCGYLVLRVGVHFPASYVLVDPGVWGGVLISKPAVYNVVFYYGDIHGYDWQNWCRENHGKPLRT